MEGRRTLGYPKAQHLPETWVWREHEEVVGVWTLGSHNPGPESQLLCLQAVWPWASHCPSLSFSLLISKMEPVWLIILHHLIIIIDKPWPQERPWKPSTLFCLPPTFIPCSSCPSLRHLSKSHPFLVRCLRRGICSMQVY